MKSAIVNLGTIVTGDWRDPYARGDCLVMEHGKIVSVGTAPTDLRDCDVIVMASHGRRGLAALLLGSETQRVLTHAPIPVLVIPAKGEPGG